LLIIDFLNINIFEGCTQSGLANFQLKLPVAELWYGDVNGIPQALTTANPPVTEFNIDLWKIQQAILRCK
jgi:hypothetical protein